MNPNPGGGSIPLEAQRLGLRTARGRPILITQGGKPAAVLVSPWDFDRMAEREWFVASIDEGLADAEAGRVLSDEQLGRELDHGLGKPKRR